MADLCAELNRLAGTTGLEAAGAANVIAGTTGLEVVGALNVRAGTSGLELNGVCRYLAGVYDGNTELDAQGALASIEELQGVGELLTEAGDDIETEAGDALVQE